MSNLPPCGACSYKPATQTLSLSISPRFVGLLHSGRLTLRSYNGEEIVYSIPNRLAGGDSAVVTGLGLPTGSKVHMATLAWVVAGDPAGREKLEQPIAVED